MIKFLESCYHFFNRMPEVQKTSGNSLAVNQERIVLEKAVKAFNLKKLLV